MEDMKDPALRMTVVIAGRSYPIKANKEEAQVLQKLEKELNDKIRKFQMQFADNDIQDCIVMAYLSHSIENSNGQQSLLPVGDTEEQIDKINGIIENAMNQFI